METVATASPADLGPDRQDRPRTESPAFTHGEIARAGDLAPIATEMRAMRAELAQLAAQLAPIIALVQQLQQVPRIAKALRNQ